MDGVLRRLWILAFAGMMVFGGLVWALWWRLSDDFFVEVYPVWIALFDKFQLPDALYEIRGHPCVRRSIAVTGKDIDTGLFHCQKLR